MSSVKAKCEVRYQTDFKTFLIVEVLGRVYTRNLDVTEVEAGYKLDIGVQIMLAVLENSEDFHRVIAPGEETGIITITSTSRTGLLLDEENIISIRTKQLEEELKEDVLCETYTDNTD
jgi:hypothetical protein